MEFKKTHRLIGLRLSGDIFRTEGEESLNDFLTFTQTETIEIDGRTFGIGQSDFCVSPEEISNFKVQRKLEKFKNATNQTLINILLNKNIFDYFLYAFNTERANEERIYVKVDANEEQTVKTKLVQNLKYDERIFNLKLQGLLVYNSGRVVGCFEYNDALKEIVTAFCNEVEEEINCDVIFEDLKEGLYLIDRNKRVRSIVRVSEEAKAEEEVIEEITEDVAATAEEEVIIETETLDKEGE